MCGIIGSCNSSLLWKFPQELKSISHRGPDGQGWRFMEQGRCLMGHTRLSVLDTGSSADQPFVNSTGRYTIVYNGELYNYRELKKEIDSLRNVQWTSSGDTEVFLESFITWGPEAVNRFNGIYAAAIWDSATSEMFLFRDRMGVKPLYYSVFDGLHFCSELSPLKQLLGENARANPSALNYFLQLGYTPEPLTFYNGIQKFPSGHWGLFKDGRLSLNSYWSLETVVASLAYSSDLEVHNILVKLLNDSVEMQLLSDVEVGAFLSGGIDSSLVCALAQSKLGKPLKTFSIGFENARYNEAPFAYAVAKHLNCDHSELYVSQRDVDEINDWAYELVGEPFADSSVIPTMLVSRMASREVKVVLSGDGGDELFLGYGMYSWAKRLNNPMISTFRNPLRKMLSLSRAPSKEKARKLLEEVAKDRIKSHIFTLEQGFFTPSEIKEMLDPDWWREVKLNENWALNRKLRSDESQAFFDLNYYLKDDLLVKVDRASMLFGLEVRVPLLDHRLVEFALNIAPDLKIQKGQNKFLLKRILKDYLPEQLINRPKWGFATPILPSVDAKRNQKLFRPKNIPQRFMLESLSRFWNLDGLSFP